MSNGWTVKDLYKCKRDLMTLTSTIINDEERKYFHEVLNSLNSLIDDFEANQPILSLSYNERLATIENELKKYKDFYDIIEDFLTKVYGFDEQLKRIENIFKPVIGSKDSYAKITGATISNGMALSITKKFYSQFDPTFYPTFLEAYSKRDESIRFVDKINGNNAADSFYIDFVKRYFIQVVKTMDPNKVFSLIHEYGHVLSYILNPKGYLLRKECMYDEVAAVFPEMLSYYTNPGNYDQVHIDFEKYSSLITVYNYANNLLLHPAYVDIWKECHKVANRKFFRAVKKELGETVEDVDEGLDTYIDSCGQYIIAYLVAIELLNIYRKDKKKALEIYRNIIMIPYNQSIHEYISSELTLGSHLEEETELFLNEFEKKLKKVGAFHV